MDNHKSKECNKSSLSRCEFNYFSNLKTFAVNPSIMATVVFGLNGDVSTNLSTSNHHKILCVVNNETHGRGYHQTDYFLVTIFFSAAVDLRNAKV